MEAWNWKGTWHILHTLTYCCFKLRKHAKLNPSCFSHKLNLTHFGSYKSRMWEYVKYVLFRSNFISPSYISYLTYLPLQSYIFISISIFQSFGKCSPDCWHESEHLRVSSASKSDPAPDQLVTKQSSFSHEPLPGSTHFTRWVGNQDSACSALDGPHSSWNSTSSCWNGTNYWASKFWDIPTTSASSQKCS